MATKQFNELDVSQMKMVLEVVASKAHTLRNLLMMLQAKEVDEAFVPACLDAAESLATNIGAMADGYLGGEIFGDADHWNFGPQFARAAVEVHRV